MTSKFDSHRSTKIASLKNKFSHFFKGKEFWIGFDEISDLDKLGNESFLEMETTFSRTRLGQLLFAVDGFAALAS